MASVPTIDLSDLPGRVDDPAEVPGTVVDAVADAASQFGFFQVVGHGVSSHLIERVWDETRGFFALPTDEKRRLNRTKDHARGFYDRELTKQARDQKEVLDLSHVPFRNLPADDPRNFQELDGPNQWPERPQFQATMIDWLESCDALSQRLLGVFAIALGEAPERLQRHFGSDHTSFVRLNHYPVDDPLTADEADRVTPLGDMALHHHSDAGALTVLMQDDVGGLQVEHQGHWLDVAPQPGAFVINTGDMMQVWSNDRFRAALHRVAPRTTAERYSIPYFFNPSYATDYEPLDGSVHAGETAHYRPLNWGHFRKARADGDFADYGTEIQISQFRA